MSFFSIAGAGAAKTMIAVTVSLHPAAAHQAGHSVTVKAGDSLSSISQGAYGQAADWPAVWWANRHQISNPSLIRVGQRLQLPADPKVTAAMIRTALGAIPAGAPAPAGLAAAPVAATGTAAAPVAAPVAAASYSGASGSFQSCVIARESGGNAGAVNPASGAGGLYGFLPSTWQALGYSGLPENAPVSVQNAAFAKEYAASGGAAWSAYDGC
jgi:resuscitation-promoting factor RpfC